MPAVLLPLALIAYLVGICLAAVATFARSEALRGGASVMFLMSWLAHGAALVQLGLAIGGLPLSNLPEYLIALGWAVMTLHLVVWFGWRVYAAGLVLPPIAAICATVALPLLPAGSHAAPRSEPWLLFHTTVSTLGMATLTVALAMSLIYVVQDRALKARRSLGLLERMPTLERCDRIGLLALQLGFLLLTVGIGTGIVVNATQNEGLWSAGAKQTLTVLAWAVFAGVLVARHTLGFRGRRSAWLTITGVTLGLLTVVGMTL